MEDSGLRFLYSLHAEVLAKMEAQFNGEEDLQEGAGLLPMKREKIRIMAARVGMRVVNRTFEPRKAGIIRAAASASMAKLTLAPSSSSIPLRATPSNSLGTARTRVGACHICYNCGFRENNNGIALI